MKKYFYVFAALMLLTSGVCAQAPEKVIIILFILHQDDKVDLAGIRVDLGIATSGGAGESDYAVVIFGEKGEVMYHTYFLPSFMVVSSGVEESDDVVFLDSASVFLRLPYSDKARKIAVYRQEREIYSLDLGVLCNRNHVCENTENAISCPGDCDEGEGAAYCNPAPDGICNERCPPEWDADCLQGTDPDYDKTQEKEPNKPQKQNNALIYALAIAAAIALIIVIRKRKGGRT